MTVPDSEQALLLLLLITTTLSWSPQRSWVALGGIRDTLSAPAAPPGTAQAVN